MKHRADVFIVRLFHAMKNTVVLNSVVNVSRIGFTACFQNAVCRKLRYRSHSGCVFVQPLLRENEFMDWLPRYCLSR